MASEVTGEEAVEGRLEMVQVSRETEEDRAINVTVGHVIAINKVRETLHTIPVIHLNQISLLSQLPPVESHNSRNPCINEGVTDLMDDLFPVQGSGTNYIDAMFQEEDKAGIGVIIRDCQGKSLAQCLEEDSEIVINALNEDSHSLASFGLPIQDVKCFANLFHCIRFSYVHREGNSVAHNLV
nr:hypothetical protein CFP56_65626 [Quercus suber]